MYLEIDEGYYGHRKTMRLCGLLENPEADVYPPRLWAWAVRSAPTGDLSGMTPYELETAMRYRPLDGRLYRAMVTAGFVDCDGEDGAQAIHDWMEHTGGAIERMNFKARALKETRAHKAGRCDRDACRHCAGAAPVQREDRAATMPAQIPARGGDEPPRPDQTSPDQTRPAKTESRKPPLSTAAPSRPTGHQLLTWFAEERAVVLGGLPWTIPPDPGGRAGTFAERLPPEAYADIRPTMRLMFEAIRQRRRNWNDERLARNPAFAFGSWISRFTELREELHKRAPQVAAEAPRAPAGSAEHVCFYHREIPDQTSPERDPLCGICNQLGDRRRRTTRGEPTRVGDAEGAA